MSFRVSWLLFWIAFFLVIAFTIHKPKAHMAAAGWEYDYTCCSGEDCQAVPLSTVAVTPGGYVITLSPKEHKQLERPLVFKVSFDDPRIKSSGDSDYHVCISPALERGMGGNNLLCLYVPVGGA